MDFVEWCSVVLDKLIEVSQTPEAMQARGVTCVPLAKAVFGQTFESERECMDSPRGHKMLRAVQALRGVGLVESLGHPHAVFVSVSRQGRQLASDLTPLWESICSQRLESQEEGVLRCVNRLCHHVDDPPWLDFISSELVAGEVGWANELPRLFQAARQLNEVGLLLLQPTPGPDYPFQANIHATYQGLVWESRRGITLESRRIDGLVGDWETTSVEFKRELHTDTADQKAELIKDLIALANTQASGPRLLVVGFDDKTHEYSGPPDPKITQDHLEDLLARYTDPMVDVRWHTVEYKAGPVGQIEVWRDPKKLPYKVAKDVGGKVAKDVGDKGDKKRVTAGQIFVRHGSHVEEPTEAELKALLEEGERARQAHGEGLV